MRQLPAGDHAAVAVQPSGTVTLVFTDIEGSTALLDELGARGVSGGAGRPPSGLAGGVSRAHSGYEVDDAGDGLFYAFASASEAVAAVAQAMASLADGPVRIRVGVHTGEPLLDPPKYVGPDVHKAAQDHERSPRRAGAALGSDPRAGRRAMCSTWAGTG